MSNPKKHNKTKSRTSPQYFSSKLLTTIQYTKTSLEILKNFKIKIINKVNTRRRKVAKKFHQHYCTFHSYKNIMKRRKSFTIHVILKTHCSSFWKLPIDLFLKENNVRRMCIHKNILPQIFQKE